MLSPTGIRASRLVVGVAATTAAIMLLAFDEGDSGIAVVLVVFGAFVLLHLASDLRWAAFGRAEHAACQQLPAKSTDSGHGQSSAVDDPTSALREGAGRVIETSGVVLGLVAAFGNDVTPALKAGSAALALCILVALILYGYVLANLPPMDDVTVRRHVYIRYLFNTALFALAFGLVSVAISIVLT